MWDVLWFEFYQIAPKLKVLLSLCFLLALTLVTIAHGDTKEVVNMGFSPKTLFPGCTAFSHFIFSDGTLFPLSIAMATLTSHPTQHLRCIKPPDTITPFLGPWFLHL